MKIILTPTSQTLFFDMINIILYRYMCPNDVLIVGRWCYTPCIEAKETLDSVPIWFVALLCTHCSFPISSSLPF